MKDNKAKIYMISSLVVLVIAVIVSGTYAYYVWTTSDSDTTKIVDVIIAGKQLNKSVFGAG